MEKRSSISVKARWASTALDAKNVTRCILVTPLLSVLLLTLTSIPAQAGDGAMMVDSLQQGLVSAFRARDTVAFMSLVAAGPDYQTVRDKMDRFFAQVAGLRVEKKVERRSLEDGRVEIEIPLDLDLQGREAPLPFTLYCVVAERPEGYRIVDVYDESERQRSHSPLYDPQFNRAGLPENVLDLVQRRCGVWAGENLEIVRTRKFEMRFERDLASPPGVWAQFSLLRYTGSGLEQHIRALVYANSSLRVHQVCARDLGSFGEEEPYMTDPDLAPQVKTWLWNVRVEEDSSLVLESERGEKERLLPSGQLELYDAAGRLQHQLERVEAVEVLAEAPAMPRPSSAPLGECLRAWQLGSSLLPSQDGKHTRALITTQHHDFLFDVSEGFCYCRSLRYETGSKGVVGKIDVRLMVNPSEFTSRMPEDLPQRLRQPVAYQEAHFDPAVCAFQDSANYWSVKSVADDLIELHGCGGAVYPYYRPGVRDKVEWLAHPSVRR